MQDVGTFENGVAKGHGRFSQGSAGRARTAFAATDTSRRRHDERDRTCSTWML